METLDYQVQDRVGWVRFTRGRIHNPLDLLLRSDLLSVLAQVRDDPEVRVLVLMGSPGAFCAGGNLKSLAEQSDAGPAYWQARLQDGLRLTADLLNLGRPVIAAVDGPAIGAGFALAMCADLVIGTPNARFAMAHLRLGLVPDLGAMYLLPRLLGLQRARELTYSTREVDAQEALRLGLMMELCDSVGLESRVREIARSMTQAAPAAIAMAKAMLNTSLDSDRQSAFQLEAASQAAAFAAAEPRSQIEALLARRVPDYSGFAPARAAPAD